MIDFQSKVISDQNIRAMLVENKREAWEFVYEKYAAIMYGIIYNLTEDSTVAKEIFIETFVQLKEKEILLNINCEIRPCILRYTNTFARQQLKDRGIVFMENHIEKKSFINILSSQYITLHELAVKVNLTDLEVKKKIRVEYIELSNRNKRHQKSIQFMKD